MSVRRISKNTFMLIVIPMIVLLTVTAVFLNYLLLSWSDTISRYLGHATYRVESIDGAQTGDNIYYKSDYITEEQLYAYCGGLRGISLRRVSFS